MALRTLYQTLLDSEPARLRVIAELWNISLQASRKADMAAELVDTMPSSERVTWMLEQLTPEQRAALDDLLRRNHAMPWASFVRRWGEVRAVGAGRLEREALWRAPVSAAEALWFAGLVQRAFEERNGKPVEMAFVPEELALYMPALPPLEVPPPPPTTEPTHQVQQRNTLADDLVTLWATLHQGGETEVEPPQEMHAPASLRLALVTTLSLEHGWLRRDNRDLLRPAPRPILQWLKADPWSQWASVARAWMESEQWNDLAGVPGLAPDPAHDWPAPPRIARQAFLETLQMCEPDTWYTIAGWIDYVHMHATDFLRVDGNYQTWAPRNRSTGVPLRGFDAWRDVEGGFIEFMLTGPLAWLGMVDLGGLEEARSPTAFRLNAAGEALLREAPQPDVPAPPPVTFSDEADFIVPPLRRYERFQLSRIAIPVGGPGEFRYQITPSSLARAKDQKIPLSRILEFLAEAAQQELPSPFVTAVQRAYRDGTSAQLRHLWILRLPTPEWRQLPGLESLMIEVLSPNLVAIRDEDRERVLKLLRSNGVLTDVDTV